MKFGHVVLKICSCKVYRFHFFGATRCKFQFHDLCVASVTLITMSCQFCSRAVFMMTRKTGRTRFRWSVQYIVLNLFEVWKMLNLYFKNHAPEILSPWLRESILTSNGQNRNPEKMNWATLSAVKYTVSCVVFIICNLLVFYCCLQCFDTVGWAAGRASGL